nr:DUF1800 family protein [Blastocatellia bacterium]
MNKFYFGKQGSLAVAVIITLLLSPTLLAARPGEKRVPLTEEQKMLHILNRLGYGARPGDIEKVRSMGIKKYIDSQLSAASLPDAVAEQKVKHLDAFGMATSELFAKYPNPGALLRQLDGGRAAQAANQANQPAQNAPDGPANQAEQRERRQKLQALYREYDLKPANQLIPQIISNRVLRAVYSERQLQEVMVD